MNEPDQDQTYERRCSATANGSGQRCKRAPALGATVCSKHGGSAPQVQAAAKRRVLAEQLRAIEDVELDDDDVDPTVAVLGALNVARERLRLLRVVYGDALLAGDPAAVRLEGEAIDRVGKLGRLAIDLGARERLDRARDAFADVIAAAHKASIARLSERKGLILDDADLTEVANYFADQLAPLGGDARPSRMDSSTKRKTNIRANNALAVPARRCQVPADA